MQRNLLDIISERGGIPSHNPPKQLQTPPSRGVMPWQNPFGGHQNNALMELMQLFQQRGQLANSMAQRHMQVPTAGQRKR